jgi:ATP-dependent Clp protease ATP-binding subunit ClpA
MIRKILGKDEARSATSENLLRSRSGFGMLSRPCALEIRG